MEWPVRCYRNLRVEIVKRMTEGLPIVAIVVAAKKRALLAVHIFSPFSRLLLFLSGYRNPLAIDRTCVSSSVLRRPSRLICRTVEPPSHPGTYNPLPPF